MSLSPLHCVQYRFKMQKAFIPLGTDIKHSHILGIIWKINRYLRSHLETFINIDIFLLLHRKIEHLRYCLLIFMIWVCHIYFPTSMEAFYIIHNFFTIFIEIFQNMSLVFYLNLQNIYINISIPNQVHMDNGIFSEVKFQRPYFK